MKHLSQIFFPKDAIHYTGPRLVKLYFYFIVLITAWNTITHILLPHITANTYHQINLFDFSKAGRELTEKLFQMLGTNRIIDLVFLFSVARYYKGLIPFVILLAFFKSCILIVYKYTLPLSTTVLSTTFITNHLFLILNIIAILMLISNDFCNWLGKKLSFKLPKFKLPTLYFPKFKFTFVKFMSSKKKAVVKKVKAVKAKPTKKTAKTKRGA